MSVLKDLRGKRFGKLQVRHYAGIYHGHAHWCCLCDCGSAVRVRGSKMLSGRIVSCGCQRANFDIRHAAAMRVSERKRKERAAMGGRAKSCRIVGGEPTRRDCGMTVDQAAMALGVHKDAVWSMMDRDIIAFRRVENGQVRLSRADVEALVEQIPPDQRWKKRSDCAIETDTTQAL